MGFDREHNKSYRSIDDSYDPIYARIFFDIDKNYQEAYKGEIL